MNEAVPPKQGFSSSRCHETARLILNEFMNTLEAEAAKVGGALTVPQIHQALDLLIKNSEKTNVIYNNAFQSCFNEFNDYVWRDKRTNVVGRLITEKFIHLLAPAKGLEPDSSKISRDILPPFFSIMNMTVSENQYKLANATVVSVVECVKLKTGKQFVWDDLPKEPEAQRMVNMLLASMAKHFADIEARKNWFKRIINTHLRHNGEAKHKDEYWQFRDEHFYPLFAALYEGLAASAEDASMAEKFDNAYGLGTSERIIALYQWVTEKL